MLHATPASGAAAPAELPPEGEPQADIQGRSANLARLGAENLISVAMVATRHPETDIAELRALSSFAQEYFHSYEMP
jgi:hypothetical protein